MNFLRKTFFTLSIIPFLAMGTSCSLLPAKLNKAYVEKSGVEKQIDDLKSKHAVEIKTVEDNITKSKDTAINGLGNQLQAITNSLYGADTAFGFYKLPNRIDLIIHNRVTEAQAATGKKPTIEAIQAENARLKTEMDEKVTSLESLTQKHNKVVAENVELVAQSELNKKVILDLEKQKESINTDYAKKLGDKQTELNTANDKIIALERQKADDAVNNAAWEHLVKLKIMSVLGILSLACLAGSIWSPVFKGNFGVASAVFGLAAIGVLYIQGWMIAAAVGLIGLVVVVKMVLDHHAVTKTATNAINYIQDTKNPAPSGSVVLSNYMGKYTSDGKGGTVVVPDPDVEKVITTILKSSAKL